jgi:hypothetical protein
MFPLLGESRTNHSLDRAVDSDSTADLIYPVRRCSASVRRLNQEFLMHHDSEDDRHANRLLLRVYHVTTEGAVPLARSVSAAH